MSHTEQLSLSWDSHQKSICTGLSVLQQRGEFVDMTLAADGHHVKVHQMVLSLVSPYIKDLISTANCPHPVIFLNNISYTILCAILEYIYTGEVLVPKHRLSDLIAAGKALHIKGLREMDHEQTVGSITEANTNPPLEQSVLEKLTARKEKKKSEQLNKEKKTAPIPTCKIYLNESNSVHEDSAMDIQDSMIDLQDDSNAVCENALDNAETLNNSKNEQSDVRHDLIPEISKKTLSRPRVQYTVSNQGSVQSIYNRYIYQLRYIKKNGTRNWRCIDYNKTRCSANIATNKKDEIVNRKFHHNHPFHDKHILYKLRLGAIYSKFQEAAINSDTEKGKEQSFTLSNKLGDN